MNVAACSVVGATWMEEPGAGGAEGQSVVSYTSHILHWRQNKPTHGNTLHDTAADGTHQTEKERW